MKLRTTLAVLTLSTLPMSLAVASDRQAEAISQCIDKAHENYAVEQGDARFWQMSQVGRYIRVWLKVRTDEDTQFKALCKVHKREGAVTELTQLGR